MWSWNLQIVSYYFYSYLQSQYISAPPICADWEDCNIDTSVIIPLLCLFYSYHWRISRTSSENYSHILPDQKGNKTFSFACISITPVASIPWNIVLLALPSLQPCFCYTMLQHSSWRQPRISPNTAILLYFHHIGCCTSQLTKQSS